MIWSVKHVILCTAVLLFSLETCKSELQLPSLMLYSPGELEYTDVLVRRVNDNLTLVCELKGASVPRIFVWNYVSNGSDIVRPFLVEPSGPTPTSRLQRQNLQLTDSGHYMCSSPPFSITKYILGEDESSAFCPEAPCQRNNRLNCSSGRCIAEASCCRQTDVQVLCRQPSCCEEHPRYSRFEAGDVEVEFPPLTDRHSPDDYGFIQSTIYTRARLSS
ncbi:unnamed protein product [Leptidea sinapis]|uniref:Ig-like domain-containing protein n=1 Tax=Leptidea sinapis TaxID=189913 RepID=A0A5E4R2A9_9NEOP|nr:unnamed protein product [Leptidea sinapis]